MKPLNKNKKYDLSQLNDEQLQAVLDWLKENEWVMNKDYFKIYSNKYFLTYSDADNFHWTNSGLGSTNALELFEEEKPHDIYKRADQLMQDGKQHGLKIVVTFEKL